MKIFLVRYNYNVQFFSSHFNFCRQPTEFFFSKKIRQMKGGQNNFFDIITKTSGLVQVWFYHFFSELKKISGKLKGIKRREAVSELIATHFV